MSNLLRLALAILFAGVGAAIAAGYFFYMVVWMHAPQLEVLAMSLVFCSPFLGIAWKLLRAKPSSREA